MGIFTIGCLKNVLRCISCEDEFLQDSLIRSIKLIDGPGLVGFFAELNQLAFHFYILNFVVRRLKHHDMVLTVHGVANGVFARRQKSATNTGGPGQYNLPRIVNSKVISCYGE